MSLDSPPYQEPVDKLGGALSTGWMRFFQTLYATLKLLYGTRGAAVLSNPYGQFSSTADQTFAAANTAQQLTLNTTTLSSGVTLASNKVTVTLAGTYVFELLPQMSNPSGAAQDAWFWMRKNGTDIVGSAVRQGMATGTQSAARWAFPVTLAASDYVEFYATVSNNAVFADAASVQAAPWAMPAIPSVAVNVTFLSA